ncbi:hypothetical protein PFICI_02985 [Pestalotiopsis fici W106-1]|uniref:Pectate lyase superfamily protein domain-containing protein n=1 Tax=Pestalotiopsis fici (strain W106-1 / CGMCC3.15140) TaxID=1229662 RepID=W3XG00_PESFW|nr:uncharacterized protein PFICI_02985 [Pestalotiopsis fici W106-1]ETS84960.1 hypothetical protein PFICI_02985 [Pestalotiopsis fici W106-1]
MVVFSLYKCLSVFSLLSSLCTAQEVQATQNLERRATECIIAARGDGGDDAPAIRTAFSKCKSNGHIIFANATYYINTVLDTRGLSDVTIDIWGKLVWSKNTTYWLANSMDVGYQNMSTVWFLGGKNLNVQGHGTGTFDGNGQTWYDLVKGESNYPHRPMGLTIWQAESSRFSGLSFVQSQMWWRTYLFVQLRATATQLETRTELTEFLDNITLRGWYIYNSDDSVSLKANATNVLIEDSVFENGLGFALGSIGQYDGKYESIYNVYLRNITCLKTRYGAYIKTWTGEPVGVPPNGGGGGLGCKSCNAIPHNIYH